MESNTTTMAKSKIFTKLRYLEKSVKKDKYLLLLIMPVAVYFIIFHYMPMYGVIIAFKDFTIGKSILESPWVGFKWFTELFNSFYFGRIFRNTLLLSIYSLIWSFPIPIIFALMINELKGGLFKRSIQTITYLPHFISVVVVVGMMYNLLSPSDGIVNLFIKSIGGEPVSFLSDPKWFRTIYIASGIWQEFGWGSIIYLAAITSIDPQLYEAAKIDGCKRWRQIWNITLPGIMPTIVILLILSIGGLMGIGFEKIILMYSPKTYETADVISTFVYRRGILGAQFSYGTAIGLFNSVINFMLLLSANRLSMKFTEISLW